MVLMPGALYQWAKRGTRGVGQWQFVVEGVYAGLLAHAFSVFFWGVLERVSGGSFFGFMHGAAIGYLHLLRQDFASFLAQPHAPEVLVLTASVYASCGATGLALRWLRDWKGGAPFAAVPDSALDVEMFRLRRRRVAPVVLLRLASGEEVEGRCRAYCFTEPREVVLEVEGGEGAGMLRWFRLDAGVAEVSLRVPASAEGTPRGRVLRLPGAGRGGS